jgi:hypothetical protein
MHQPFGKVGYGSTSSLSAPAPGQVRSMAHSGRNSARRICELALLQLVPARVKDQLDGRAMAFEIVIERVGHRWRADRVPLAGRDRYAPARKARLVLWGERNQRVHENRRRQEQGILEQQICQDVGAIRTPPR